MGVFVRWGTRAGGSIYFERLLKEVSRKGAFRSSGDLLGDPGGGLHYWGSRRICKELWRWTSVSMGTLLGYLEWGSFTRVTSFQQLKTVITVNIPTTRIAYSAAV